MLIINPHKRLAGEVIEDETGRDQRKRVVKRICGSVVGFQFVVGLRGTADIYKKAVVDIRLRPQCRLAAESV